ncbi:hypothetical protein FACS1894192_08040 [Bacilli bacterium]|nr:hypothetical protein FACS1894192_08040 [Bacilli bacterium]
MTNIVGLIANLLSIVLWMPQARTTWQNRKNPQAIKGISLETQIIVAANTICWCIYGFMTHDFWLPIGTACILPLAICTIYIKIKTNNEFKKEQGK